MDGAGACAGGTARMVSGGGGCATVTTGWIATICGCGEKRGNGSGANFGKGFCGNSDTCTIAGGGGGRLNRKFTDECPHQKSVQAEDANPSRHAAAGTGQLRGPKMLGPKNDS